MQADQFKNLTSSNNTLYGIGFMLIHAVSIALLYAVMKYLTKNFGLSSSQVVFFYKFSILVLIVPWIFKDGLKYIYTQRFSLHVLRGFLSIGGSLSFMYALQHVRMVDATALGYLEQVALVIIGIFYFKEALTYSKIISIFASVAGTIIIMYPSILQFNDSFIPVLFQTKEFSDFNRYYVFVFLSIIFWASNCIIVKSLGKTEHNKTQLFYVMLFSSIFAFPFTFIKWHWQNIDGINLLAPEHFISIMDMNIDLESIMYIGILALCYFLHNIAIFKAYKSSEMSTVAPFDYSRLVFTGVLAFIIFSEKPILQSYFGYILIVGSGILLIRSEAIRRKNNQLKQQEIVETNTDMDEDFTHA